MVKGERRVEEFYEELGEGEELVDEVVEFYIDGKVVEIGEWDFEEDVEIYDYEYSFDEDDSTLDELYDDISADMLSNPSDKDYLTKVKEGIINGEVLDEGIQEEYVKGGYEEVEEEEEEVDRGLSEVYDVDFDDIYVEVESGE